MLIEVVEYECDSWSVDGSPAGVASTVIDKLELAVVVMLCRITEVEAEVAGTVAEGNDQEEYEGSASLVSLTVAGHCQCDS